jgi:PST family polysaccharide transporter
MRVGFTAFNWNYVGLATASLMRFVVGALLARILGPEPFGQIAVALIVIGLGTTLSDFGLGTILVQRPKVSDELIVGCFTLQVALGSTLSVCWFFVAPVVARYFGTQDATLALQALSLVFFFSSLGQTSAAILRREFRTKGIQLVQVATYLMAYLGIGVPLAVFGAGVWSLAVAQIVQSMANTALLYVQVRHGLLPTAGTLDLSTWFSGVRVAGSNMIDWILLNLDSIFVGKAFGTTTLGYYNRSFFTVFTPANVTASSMKGALLPLLARIQGNQVMIGKTYLSIVALVAFTISSAFFAIAMVPSTLVSAIYGPDWSSAAPLLTPLSIAMPSLVLVAVTSSTLWAAGAFKVEMLVQTISLVITVLILSVLVHQSALAIAWAMVGIYAVRYILLALVVGAQLKILPSQLFGCMVAPVLSASIVAMIVRFADVNTASLDLPIALRLFIDMGAGMAAVSFMLLCIPKAVLGADGMWMYLKLPPRARRFNLF